MTAQAPVDHCLSCDGRATVTIADLVSFNASFYGCSNMQGFVSERSLPFLTAGFHARFYDARRTLADLKPGFY